MLFLSENHKFSSAKLTEHACFPIQCGILFCSEMRLIVKVAPDSLGHIGVVCFAVLPPSVPEWGLHVSSGGFCTP